MHGNRMMGGVVWFLVLVFFIWGIFKRYGGPSKWSEPIGIWVQNNKLAAFFGVLLVTTHFSLRLIWVTGVKRNKESLTFYQRGD